MPDGKLHVLHTTNAVTPTAPTSTVVSTPVANGQQVVVKTPIPKATANKQVLICAFLRYVLSSFNC